jgi:hypothetical protein
VKPEKVAVIPNGLDPAYREPIPAEEIDAVLTRSQTIGCSGRCGKNNRADARADADGLRPG